MGALIVYNSVCATDSVSVMNGLYTETVLDASQVLWPFCSEVLDVPYTAHVMCVLCILP